MEAIETNGKGEKNEEEMGKENKKEKKGKVEKKKVSKEKKNSKEPVPSDSEESVEVQAYISY